MIINTGFSVGTRVDRLGPDTNLYATTPVRTTAYGSVREAVAAFRANGYGDKLAVGIVKSGDAFYGYRLATDDVRWDSDLLQPIRNPFAVGDLRERGFRFDVGSPLKAIIDGTLLVTPDGTGYGVAMPSIKS